MKLIGVLIIVIGFILKLDTIAVVVIAGLSTGLVSGLSFNEVVEILGKAFVENRYMSIFIISLPLIGLLERYGLKERAAYLIGKIKSATVGKLTSMYLAIRALSAAANIRIGGHVQFIRPLILPMAKGAAENKYGKLDEEDEEHIKGLEAAVENYGNFFAQNVFPGAGGVLLIVGSLKELNYKVEALDVAKASIPVAIIIVIIGSIQFFYYDKKFNHKYKNVIKEKNSLKS
ncbi:DUF969 domain-containing protein [Clostridium rectalis]|uniref:DUF969 domain-containing protein n=1 Tax=Clostridium rectalis TaxID=2040295 RepID=UPI00242EECB2|nr:DUF969 domain-containing protein [Clostridium rectalis]